MRSMHGEFGFNPQNAMLVDTDLSMAGYSGDRLAPMQRRMIEALQTIPGVKYVGLSDALPLGDGNTDSNVFTDNVTDLKPANAAFDAGVFRVSPDYFHADGTELMFGREFTWHDDKDAPRVAVVNGEFARKIFGSGPAAMGRYFKMPDGGRIQVVGVAQDGKYGRLTENPMAEIFLPILQSPSQTAFLVVRSDGDAQQMGPAIRATLRRVDAGLPVFIQPRYKELDAVLFGPRVATISLGVLGMMGAMLSITGIFGMAAYSVSKRLRELGIRIALGAQRKEVLQAALGRAVKLMAFGSAAGLVLGILASRVLAFVVYQATPRDPVVLTGVVLAMALLGLVATWIPAQRALSVDPLMLLREE
jgi:predicted permease